MTEFFQHFPPELSKKTAFKMMFNKMLEAKEKFKDGDDTYIDCLEKLKDMLTLYLRDEA